MFFYLSKILGFIISPFTWIFIGLLFLVKKTWYSPFKKWTLGITIFTYLITNSFLVDELVRAWEYEDDHIYQSTSYYDAAIVLGGMGYLEEKEERIIFSYGGDRLFQTLDLFYKKRIGKLIITGGSGSISRPNAKEAIYIKKYLLNLNIPDSCIIIESNSKNTYENAVFTKQILDSMNYKGNTLLVTSSYHMRRSLAIFNKAGYQNLTPMVTNKITGDRKFLIDYCFIPNSDALFSLNLIMHEIIGYSIYKLKGYL